MENQSFIECIKDKNVKILQLLNEYKNNKKMKDDIEEYIHSIQTIQVILNRLLLEYPTLVGKKCNSILQNLYSLLQNFENKIQNFEKQGKLIRIITNNRLRKQLDHLNSKLCMEMVNYQKEIMNQAKILQIPRQSITEEKKKYPSKNIINFQYVLGSPIIKPNKSHILSSNEPNVFSNINEDENSSYNSIKNFLVINQSNNSLEIKNSSNIIFNKFEKYKQEIDNNLCEIENKWIELFGEDIFVVPWNEFINQIKSEIFITENQEFMIKDIIDHSNTYTVNKYKFIEFMKGFGPFKNSIKNVENLCSNIWFHGYLTMEESKKYLELEPLGTFIVRFSNSKPGSFSIDYVTSHQNFGHLNNDIHVYGAIPSPKSNLSLKEKKYGIMPSPNESRIVESVLIESLCGYFKINENLDINKEISEERIFYNISDILNYYTNILTIPFTNCLSKESWFHGDLQSEEAEELLRGYPYGTFLIRFSSQPGCFASSYVDQNGIVIKSLIKKTSYGYQVDKQPKIYSSINDLVQEYIKANIFKYPFTNGISMKKKTSNRVKSAPLKLSSELDIKNLSKSRDYGEIFQKNPVYQWDVDDVIYWLQQIGLNDIIPVFRQHYINGVALLELTEEDMKNELKLVLGIRRQLLKAIRELK